MWSSASPTEAAPAKISNCPACHRFPHALAHVRLISGWHEPEVSGWRWTEREFIVGFDGFPGIAERRIAMRVLVPEALIEELGPITLRASAGGEELETQRLVAPGDHRVALQFKPRPGSAESDTVTFSLDKALAPRETDCRELGIVVGSIEFE
jgi:hypothetical protein